MSEPVVAYNTEAKRVTYEDFKPEHHGFGFRLRWAVLDHWADVTVWEYVGQNVNQDGSEGSKFFTRAESNFSPDPTEDVNEAEVTLEGYIKWDGCTELDMGRPHWCGPNGGWRAHIELLEHIYHTAFELMGKPLPSKWADPLDY